MARQQLVKRTHILAYNPKITQSGPDAKTDGMKKGFEPKSKTL